MEANMISVIVPVLNAEHYIRYCVDSLIGQDFPKDQYEIIIVDNGSKDNTCNTVIRTVDMAGENALDKKDTTKIIITKERKKGAYIARNAGIKLSKGEIIAFTDADCVADRNWLKELHKAFGHDIGCVAGSINPLHGKTLVEIYSMKKEILSQKQTLFNNFLPYGQTANVAYRKDILDKIGLFDDSLMSGGDADIAWRMQIYTDYKLIYEPKAVVEHRHRTTFKGLFKQQFRYGFGNMLLYKKYRGHIKKDLSNNIKYNYVNILKLIMTINLFYLRSFKRLFGLCDRYQQYEPILYFIYMSGFALGKIYGWIKLRESFLNTL